MADTDAKAGLGGLTPPEAVGKLFAALDGGDVHVLDMTPVYE